ncbi:MAG: carboxypeptidase regulatory-like domain-containing protein, partial [Terriglobales bacterium]
MRRNHHVFLLMSLLCAMLVGWAAGAAAQVNTADLSGTVYDPSGGTVKGAKVTVTSLSTGASREATTDDSGRYSFALLPPGRYKLTVSGAANFSTLENPELVLTIGAAATFDAHLQLAGATEIVRVTESTAPIETTKTDVSQTVDQRRIDNLPINGRGYLNFTLTNSQTTRDSAPSIGAAPTSGLNMGGQRARSNEVSVDGADAVDNSVNGIRSTVSQEAVQEFQLILSNYNAEYGRATGGVVNIVTKSGSNELHGNLFGYLRHKSIQARNPFSGEVDSSGTLVPTKQAYTRVQAGATLGGPLVKDKTFYFLSYEITRRQETGFTNIGANNFGLSPLDCGPGCPLNGLFLTSAQATAVNTLLATGSPALIGLASNYAAFMGSASSVALFGIDPGLVGGALTGGLPGARFPIPVPCPPGATVNGVPCITVAPGVGRELAPLPGSFVPLEDLRGNYPIKEGTSLWSARLDHRWSNSNNSFVRVGISPSLATGIQVNAQNQTFGQNAGSRTSLQQVRDFSIVGQHDTIIGPNTFNQARFQ